MTTAKHPVSRSAFSISQFRRRLVFGLLVASCLSLGIALASPIEYMRAFILFAVLIMTASLLISAYLGANANKELLNSRKSAEAASQTAHQIEELFAMTDMLQAAEGHADAGAVLMATANRLLPEYGGALYVFNNSRDRLDLAKSWNTKDNFDPPHHLSPNDCWALKRGKPHINDPGSNTLCCAHHSGQVGTVEIPMMARGTLHGLLTFAIESDESFAKLMSMRRLGRAIADSMSLALSNIALHEKLRTQSLRDPLTGLYNRRYMEDALLRCISLAERSGGSTAAVMIDLDNFKQLNDVHGHAKGDAVLRDVAMQLVGALRPTDVVCRFGGEELTVILPGCGLEDAMLKCEVLRQRVESLTDVHGFPISASFGVASVPETSTSPTDIIPMADTALYAAKQAGKNRVHAADRRAGREESAPRLAVG
jgi:diguanylate cyclase (GGDEF)-like protein